MEEIFHEKQEGSLCAQHCLNALLQAAYFTAVDLATIAQQMDEEERSRMAEGGLQSDDYRKFMQQPSSNVDDSGYFSVQVIASALKVWGLDLIPYNSQNPLAQDAQRDPTQLTAYICNYRDHWLTIRKLGYQWFNLNSLLTGPELVSNTYLSLFLAQLQQEGYSIFIVDGNLPECTSDQILRLQPARQSEKPRLISETKQVLACTQEEVNRAFGESLEYVLEQAKEEEYLQTVKEEEYLQTALSISLTEFQGPSGSVTEQSQSVTSDILQSSLQLASPQEMSEQEMLEAALKMSMETS